MFCSKCGSQIPDGSKFCSSCGAPCAVPQISPDGGCQNGYSGNQGGGCQNGYPGNQGGGCQDGYQGNQGVGCQNGYPGNQQWGSYYGARPLRTDRDLVTYILLSIITCGIYGYWFVYKLAQDVNVACEGDGEETPGLAVYILLNLITCGMYNFYWMYKIGNRLAQTAYRKYGFQMQENGTTILVWLIFGSLLCGIGYFIGNYILIKNTNAICDAYNQANGFGYMR